MILIFALKHWRSLREAQFLRAKTCPAKDKEALAWGKKLAAIHHSPDSGMEEAESIAYLGLSYWDLALRYGEGEAAKLWAEKGRHAFLPLTVLERVIDSVKPDIVVTTNSPKSEQAAIEVANKKNILTLSTVDLFGIHHFHPLEAKYMTVICQQTIDNMRNEGVSKPDNAFIIAGNPAFDRAFDYRGPTDYAYRKTHFPSLPPDKPILLWIDMPAYWNLIERRLHTRSSAEVIRDLDTLADATAKNCGSMLIRPHPSQPRAIYDEWMKKYKYPHVAYAGGTPLYPLLKAVDVVASYTSTVTVEALLMERRVLKLKYEEGRNDVPLGEWGMAWQADSPAELPDKLNAAFNDNAAWKQMQERIKSILPQERAGPGIATHIKRLLKTA